MECTYCGAELEQEDSYGNHVYICHGDTNGKSGEIFRCPNHEGFENIEDSIDCIIVYYGKQNDNIDKEQLDKLILMYFKEFEITDLTEVCCESSCHNVSGSFYTDNQGNLFEGYPC